MTTWPRGTTSTCPLNTGRMVEERDDVGLVEHDVARFAPGDDRAEQAAVAGHRASYGAATWLVAPR